MIRFVSLLVQIDLWGLNDIQSVFTICLNLLQLLLYVRTVVLHITSNFVLVYLTVSKAQHEKKDPKKIHHKSVQPISQQTIQ